MIIPRMYYRAFVTKTPRGWSFPARYSRLADLTFTPVDFAELNAPPMINYGAVYPQAILVFVITMLYSVIQPLIMVFGAAYFGISYVVYKYKLLFGELSSASTRVTLTTSSVL